MEMKVTASTGAAHEKIMRLNLIKHEENFVRDFVYEMMKYSQSGMFRV